MDKDPLLNKIADDKIFEDLRAYWAETKSGLVGEVIWTWAPPPEMIADSEAVCRRIADGYALTRFQDGHTILQESYHGKWGACGNAAPVVVELLRQQDELKGKINGLPGLFEAMEEAESEKENGKV